MALTKIIQIFCQLVVFVFLQQRIPEARRFKTSTSFLNSYLFSSSVWHHVSFDLYRQSRTNQSSSIEETTSCAVLKCPCRFVRFRLSKPQFPMKADQPCALQQKEVRCFLLKKQEKYGQPLKCPAPAMKKGRQLLPLRNHPHAIEVFSTSFSLFLKPITPGRA